MSKISQVDDIVYLDRNQSAMGKVVSIQQSKMQVQLIFPISKFQTTSHTTFYRELILVNQTKQVKCKELDKINALNLSDYLNNFYNFENQTLDYKKIEEQNAYLLRFFLKGKKDFVSINSNQNICFYCSQTQKEGDIYKCQCGKLYHLTCYEREKKCLECDKNLLLDLKQNNTQEEFDFSNINYQSYKKQNDLDQKPVRIESQKEILKQRNSISKDATELNQYFEKFKKNYKQKNVNQSLIIRNKIRNQYFKIFLKVAYQNKGNEQKIGKLSEFKLEDLSLHVEKLALSIDKIMYTQYGESVSKNSPYSQRSKELIYSLKHHNKQIVEQVLSKDMTINELCSLSKEELADQSLLKKIEREKKELWEARKIEEEDIAKPINFKQSGDKNANKEIVPVALESEAKNNKLKENLRQNTIQSQKSIDQQEKETDSNTNESKINDILEFKENLLSKMKEYLSDDLYEELEEKLKVVYDISI